MTIGASMRRFRSANLNAFGEPIAPYTALDRVDRIELLERAAGTLQAGEIDAYTARWLGSVLATWLQTDDPLEDLLGVSSPQGNRMTVAGIIRQHRKDDALMDFATLVGGARKAEQILNGKATCPTRALPLLEKLREVHAPTSFSAIMRARGRLESRHRR